MNKTISIKEIFTQAELDKATELYHQCQEAGERFGTRCAKEIVEPILPRINEATGQENDQLYFAYILEYGIRFGSKGLTVHSSGRKKHTRVY